MTETKQTAECVPMFVARSRISTDVNQTGTWRFVRPVYGDKTAPCSAACPTGEDIARIEMLAAAHDHAGAWRQILMENPLPAVCGRVCFHPCEGACNREKLDDAIAVHHLERFLGDRAIAEKTSPGISPAPAKNQRVAIVGAGPAGLSAAWFLRLLGYECVIFESSEAPGGMLRWAIPGYRLPSSVLEHEIQRIIDCGVNIKCNHHIEADFMEKARDLYAAIFIGCGYNRPIRLQIPGGELAVEGLDFLSRVRRQSQSPLSGTAAIIGGGNTAIDVARSLVRIGVLPTIVYRRRLEDMPAFACEIQMAQAEGVAIMELAAPVSVKKNAAGLQLAVQPMKVAGKTSAGRARVVADATDLRQMHIDHLFTAIGAEPAESWQHPPADPDTGMDLGFALLTDGPPPMVFGGDLATDTKSVTDAIASGKTAAMAIDTLLTEGVSKVAGRLGSCRVGNGPALSFESYLGGTRKKRLSHVVRFSEINTDYFIPSSRAVAQVAPMGNRVRSFTEIDQTLSDATAGAEARRCFNCGLCNHCDNCRLYCPELAVTAGATRQINYDYCKGCGICVTECPRNAMALEEETS